MFVFIKQMKSGGTKKEENFTHSFNSYEFHLAVVISLI